MKTIAIVLEGGLVQGVVSEDQIDDIQIVVIDYDPDSGEEEEGQIQVSQNTEPRTYAPAWCSIRRVERSGIDIQAVVKSIKEDSK